MGFFDKIRSSFARFMSGRYGADQLGMTMLWTSLILSIVGLVLSVVMLIACVICVAAGSAAADEIANNPELQNEIASALDQISSSVQ